MAINGWQEYQKLVLAKMEEHGIMLTTIAASLTNNAVAHEQIRGEIKALKMKAGIWGMIAGALPSLVAVLILILKG